MPDSGKPGLARPAAFALIAVILCAVAFAGVKAVHHRERLLMALGFPAPSPAPPFAGASRSRIFLGAQEQAEAVRRGLVPAGARSIIGTGGPLQYGQWKWDETGVPAGPLMVRINLRRQLISVYRGGDEIGTAVIAYGDLGKDTPIGNLPVLRKVRDYHSRSYDAPMPFSLFISNDGVAVHGSPVAADHATNGCVGLPVGFAAKLYDVARVGDIIEIREGG